MFIHNARYVTKFVTRIFLINKNKHLAKMKLVIYGIRVTKKLQSKI